MRIHLLIAGKKGKERVVGQFYLAARLEAAKKFLERPQVVEVEADDRGHVSLAEWARVVKQFGL